MNKQTANWVRRYYESGHYIRWYSRHGYFSRTQEEVDFIVSRTIQAGRALDVGCGHGRHCIELAKRGFETVGIDISKNLIAQAVKASRGFKTQFLVDDARQMSRVVGQFDLVVSIFSSFGLHEHADNCLVIRNMADRLGCGGFLFLDVDSIHEIKRYVATTGGIYIGGHFSEQVVIDPTTNVVRWTERWRYETYSGQYHLYSSRQILEIIELAGLKAKWLFGSFQGERYSFSSQRLIVIATKT